ncbi:MAG: hypothetical protein J6K28_05480 [Alistipes sp.]|nr:hypothetical protein [Alistipes sp.]
MKIILFLYCLLFTICCSSSHKPVNCVLLTSDCYTKIFDRPNGAIVDSIVNSPAIDELYVMDIVKCKNEWFFVEVYLPISDSISHIGWIRYPNVGIYMKDLHNVKLYDRPSYESSVKLEIENAEWGPYVVTGFYGEWLQIELNYFGVKVHGWLPPNNQSSNPYTTGC